MEVLAVVMRKSAKFSRQQARSGRRVDGVLTSSVKRKCANATTPLKNVQSSSFPNWWKWDGNCWIICRIVLTCYLVAIPEPGAPSEQEVSRHQSFASRTDNYL
ncbi:hypothetical protein KIN20_006242 [Parelaphostrongylus tenuis]|uniref:Uncharacterized protein n=1 Tax=Parelaphostrongylus tenuis TaxID=148309 RepID=A0AAD5M5R7_PARTN|nr:hypothetical protein KIN20_006242 [Parelaphostrongylus tenuis]